MLKDDARRFEDCVRGILEGMTDKERRFCKSKILQGSLPIVESLPSEFKKPVLRKLSQLGFFEDYDMGGEI